MCVCLCVSVCIYIYIYLCVCVCVCVYIYIYIYCEMVDFGESKKKIKISEKMNKSETYNRFSSNISFFIRKFLQTKHLFFLVFLHLSNFFLNCLTAKKFTKMFSLKKFLNKKRNITTKPEVSVLFIHLSSYFIIYIYIYIVTVIN